MSYKFEKYEEKVERIEDWVQCNSNSWDSSSLTMYVLEESRSALKSGRLYLINQALSAIDELTHLDVNAKAYIDSISQKN